MATGKVETTGLTEMRAAVEQLPDAITRALRTVARQTALREQETARVRLRARQKTEAHALADNITVEEDADKHEMRVVSMAPADQPANVPTWNEFGTVYMGARPYMRPAEDVERDRYQREMEAASMAAATTVLKA